MTTRLTLRMPEVAEQLGVGLSTVQRWTASGELVSVRVGGVVLITPEDLATFLATHREGRGVPRMKQARARGAA